MPKTRHSRQRPRNYKAEYERRIAKGLASGKSLSQARGHARAGERIVATTTKLVKPSLPEEQALRSIKAGSTLKAAAQETGVPPERLRRYIKENTAAHWTGRRWRIEDIRPRQMPLYSRGKLVSPWLPLEEARRAGEYMARVRPYLQTGSDALIAPYRSQSVRDVKGRVYPFETDEDTLFELDNMGELNFPEYYKIVA